MEVRTDLAQLQRLLRLPDGAVSCRFITRPVGQKSPFLPFNPPHTVFADIVFAPGALASLPSEAHDGGETVLDLNADEVRAVAPALALRGRENDGRLSITGTVLRTETLGRAAGLRVSHAWRLDNELLVRFWLE